MIICPSCGTMNREDSRYCQNCGTQLSAGQLAAEPAGKADLGAAAEGDLPITAPLSGSRPARPPALVVGCRSHVGQKRELNEDCLVTLGLQRVRQSQGRPLGLYVVADGMGGHAAGEVASACAIDTLAAAVLKRVIAPDLEDESTGEPDYGALLHIACQDANRAVFERARKAHSDMGTTLVAALIAGEEAWIANVGDSRAYLVDPNGIQQITLDHSLVARLVAAGKITREEARTHPERNMIYRTLGEKPQVEIDIFRPSLTAGSALVLCTDGLHGLVEESVVRDVVLATSDPQAACDRLIDLANQAGGHDNITVIIVRIA